MMEEKVGAQFDSAKLHRAQKRTWALLRNFSREIRPSMSEADALAIYQRLLLESGAEKQWHPAKVRFGVNTLRAFREPSQPNVVLKNDDVFFLDIGPVFDGYEGDCGETFTVGDFPAAAKVVQTGKQIFSLVAERFRSNRVSGTELYRYAEQLALERGYELVGEGASGHRVSEFPHAVHFRGPLRKLEHAPAADRWILEIQLRDVQNYIGAFYEDLLA